MLVRSMGSCFGFVSRVLINDGIVRRYYGGSQFVEKANLEGKLEV